MANRPTLKPLHPDSLLSRAKLTMLAKLSTEVLQTSLLPGQEGCLKVRPDGTMLDGHHRVHILKNRGIDVDGLPREIIQRDSH